MVDTGAALSTLDPEYASGKSWKRAKTGGTVRTLGKTAALETVTVPLTDFGVFQVPNMSYALVPGGGRRRNAELDGRKVVGILGMNTLMPLRAVLDFGSGQVLFPIHKLNAKRNSPASTAN